jgi:hypothetical protein
LADDDSERYAALLAQQFAEKEGMMKQLLGKYADQKLAESEAVRDKFQKDGEMLE